MIKAGRVNKKWIYKQAAYKHRLFKSHRYHLFNLYSPGNGLLPFFLGEG